jgi:hypothetical protein
MSALGQKTFAPQDVCPLYTRKRTCAVQPQMSALGHKRTSQLSADGDIKQAKLLHSYRNKDGGAELGLTIVETTEV